MPGRSGISRALLGLVLLGCTAQAARGDATLSLTAPPCVNTNTLVVNMDLVQSTQVAVGAQVFLQYDNLKLQFVSADPGDPPFTFQVFESVNQPAGTIDYAVGIASPGTGVTAPPTRTMARFTFTILPGAAACSVSNLVSFRATGPNGALNKVSDNQVPNQPIVPLFLNNLPAIRIDQMAPVTVSSGPIGSCYPTVAAAEAAALANSSATDNCTASPVETVQTVGTCFATVTVKFTDECGNISTIPYSTRIDGTKPVITCPANITVTAGTNQCNAVVNYPAPGVTDNCDPAPTVTCSVPSGSVFLPGTTTVSCTAKDSCNNISDPCSFNVTVNLLPTTLTLASTGCQPNGQLVVSINMSNACKIVVGGQYFLQYDTARLQFVSAVPGDAPFTKQVFEFVNTGLGTIDYATGIPDGGTGTSAPTTMARITFNVILDDCSTTNLVTWRPSGPGGIPNRLSDDQVPAQPVLPLAVVNLPSVTLDITDPVITGVPANTTVQCNAVPSAPATLPASDNCDLSVTTATLNPDQITPGTCPQSYTITRTWTATDACGNSATATQIITVQDTTAPSVGPAPANVTISCETPLPVAPATLPASDNCDPTVTAATLNPDQTTPGNCAGNYIVTRTWTATDACGNATTRTQIITVHDITLPIINCPAATTVQCASLVPVADFAGGSATDLCDLTPTVIHVGDVISNQTCANRYTITRTYKATDDCNNFATCDQIITVNDTTVPLITCPGPATVQCASSVPAANFAGGTTSDNCGGTPAVTHVGDVISNQTCPNRYTITRTYKATDVCGNFATCDQTITVNDTTAPVITLIGPAVIHIQCNATPYQEQGATWTDNCDGGPFPVTNITYTPTTPTNQNGTFTAHYNAMDACGNAAIEVTRTIIIENPVPTCNSPQPLTIPCQCSNACVPATNPIIAAWLASAIPVDGCDNDAVITGNDAPPCFPVGTTTVTWTVTDRDNVPPIPNTCSSTVTVVADLAAPTITCPVATTVQCASLVPVADFAGGSATDLCDLTPTVIHVGDVISNQTCANRYTITRTYKATDDCNNFATCDQIITVNDTTVPLITCPGPATVQCASSVPAADFSGGTTSDNCGGTPTVTHVGDVISAQTCANRYTITRTYKSTDACGNFATCDQTITVNDITAPTATQGTVNACYQSVAAANAAALAATTNLIDNCAQAPGKAILTSATEACSTTIVVQVSDACGNFTNYTYNTRVDNTAPTATQGTIDACYDTVAAANAAALDATTNLNDNCDPSPGKAILTSATEACSTPIVVRVTDSCGNFTNYTYNTRVDNTAPIITLCPSNITVHAAAGSCSSAPVTYVAAATDNCTTPPTVTFSPPSGSTFPVGTTTVTVTATDECGNFSTCTFTVTNDGQSEVSVVVELGGGAMANGTFTRGITFALWNTGVDNVNPLFTTCVTMSFSGNNPVPKTATATFLAPCQPTGYTCITGRDRLHTLRRTISPIPISGLAYAPSFTGLKALIGGNLNDDRFIDILDFGIYTTQDLTVAPGGVNTVCGQNPPLVKHADINGTPTGVVNSLDYSFISNNFLMTREANCNGSLLTIVASDGGTAGIDESAPVTSITLTELNKRGLGELTVMDLNHDGVFDLTDKDLWGQGVRPTPPPTSAPIGGKPLKTGQPIQPASSRTP